MTAQHCEPAPFQKPSRQQGATGRGEGGSGGICRWGQKVQMGGMWHDVEWGGDSVAVNKVAEIRLQVWGGGVYCRFGRAARVLDEVEHI